MSWNSWYRNSEHYWDPTAGEAFENILREEREKRRKAALEKRKSGGNGRWRLAWTSTNGTISPKKGETK